MGSGAIPFHPAFRELQQKSFGRRDTALASAFADRHHLTEYGLIGCFPVTPARTTGRIATPTFCKFTIPDVIVFSIITAKPYD
jgi:hypothetical protein